MGWYEDFYSDGRFAEYVIENIIKSSLGADDLLLDGGANEGRHTLVGLSTGARVIAVEPIPAMAEKVRARAVERGFPPSRLEVVNAALAHEAGRAEFTYCPTRSTLSGLMSRERTKDLPTELINVEVVTIDQLLAARENATPAVIKLDLEGGEYNALRGASTTLAGHPIVVLEHGGAEGARLYGYSYDDYWDYLRGLGYTLMNITGRDCTLEEFRSPRHWNYVAVAQGVPAHAELVRRFDYLTADAAQKMALLHSVRTSV